MPDWTAMKSTWTAWKPGWTVWMPHWIDTQIDLDSLSTPRRHLNNYTTGTSFPIAVISKPSGHTALNRRHFNVDSTPTLCA